ncbi:MAG TPA: LuxR C-terminal-related transcriptional regulator [Chloroflexota bacterium]|jgi:DNA-binding NarL/FixJ family response regulator
MVTLIGCAARAADVQSAACRRTIPATDAGAAGLTPREREVAAPVARGLTNREIAEELVITPGTVGTHIEHILARLNLRSRAAIAAWWVNRPSGQ